MNGTVRSAARIGGALTSFLLTAFLRSPVAAGLISFALGGVWLTLCMQARAAYVTGAPTPLRSLFVATLHHLAHLPPTVSV